MGRRFAPLELDEVERRELTSLASRRSTAWRCGLESSWRALEASRARSWRPDWILIPTHAAWSAGAR
jgi:hypothetical protein